MGSKLYSSKSTPALVNWTSSLKISTLILLVLVFINGYSQYNKLGYPFTRNFNFKEIKAPGANTAVAINSKGVVYFANAEKGVLEYDGISWKIIPLKNFSPPRSLAVDSNDIVYVGAAGEIGYIAPDSKGSSVYHSLNHLIDTSKYVFNNVWKTYATSQGVFLCAPSHIIHFRFPNYIKVVKLPNEAFTSFYLNNKLINGFYKVGLQEVKDTIISPLPGVEPLIDLDIREVLPLSDNLWLLLTSNGLYFYNTIKIKVVPWKDQPSFDKTNKVLRKNTLYNGCTLPMDNVAITTIDNGIYILDDNLTIENNYNAGTGFLSSTVFDLEYNSSQGVLWAAMDNGLSKIEYNTPLRIFGKESNLKGTILSAIKVNNTLYVGGLTGLFYLDFDENGLPVFKEFQELSGRAVYSLLNLPLARGGSKILAGTSDDILEVVGTKAYPLKEKGVAVNCGFISKKIDNTVFFGSGKGIKKVTWANGKWVLTTLPDNNYIIFSLFEDRTGNLWASTSIDGLLKIQPDGSTTRFTTKDGLPSNSGLRVYYYEQDNRILVSSLNGLYEYNHSKNMFEPSNFIQQTTGSTRMTIGNMFDGYKGSVWAVVNSRLKKLTPKDGGFTIDSVTFKRLPEMSFEYIYNEPDGITWMCTSEGLISYDNNFQKTPPEPYYTLIRNITSNDSLIFGGIFQTRKIMGNDTLLFPAQSQPVDSKIELRYRNNNLTFTLAAPYFQDESANKFSYLLKGYDEGWTKWSEINRAVYTNLREGNYTFRARAINVYGEISQEASFQFQILPPWYRTIWAYIGYIILGLLILIITVKLYTHKLEEDKKRLEGIVAERTAEVVKQKIEIEHKNKEITDSIVYAKRIQEALLPVRDQITIPNLELFVYFKPKDIVSGDFFFLKQIPEANTLVATAADCTGHGVPGAFMSMLGLSFLNELVVKPENLHSDEILNQLRLQVIASLNPKGIRYETKDGMDISLIVYNYETNHLEYSGANNPLYLIRNGELNEIKADKMPIGLHERCGELFRCEELTPLPGDIIYMFSDGFVDQFGGDKGKKYLSKNFKEFLLTIHNKPMPEQEKLIEEESIRWRGDIEQIDDQCVMGIKFLL